MKNTACIILAAGRGTRMKSTLPKVLHKLSGKTMIEYVLNLVKPLSFKPVIVIVGYKGDEVKKVCKECVVIRQEQLLGSADAVMSAKKHLKGFKGDVIVLYGDMPLIERETIKELISIHKGGDSSCTLLTAVLKNPPSFGRIVRDKSGNVSGIIEEQDATLSEKEINEVNVGAYCFKSERLFEYLKKIKNDNKKKEYYLTDIIAVLRKEGMKIGSLTTYKEEEVCGINSKVDLARAERIIKDRTIKRCLNQGVTIVDPINTYISPDSIIGQDTVINPYTIIEESTKIGSDCVIGPFARLRAGAELDDKVEIGNFVEITRSKIGEGTKIKHHSYIGDTIIGKNVNIGAGTITANYDGKNKNKTVIKDGVFVGSGTIFVAPVTVGKKAITGAGSVLTKNTKVPDGSTVVGVPARILEKRINERRTS